jgi:hypothetical protein
MTRYEQIEEFIKFHAHKFSVRNGYTTTEDLMREMAQWCDNNPKSQWRDAKKELPMMGELVNVASGRGIGFMRYIDPTDFIGNNVEYWMPIPQIETNCK